MKANNQTSELQDGICGTCRAPIATYECYGEEADLVYTTEKLRDKFFAILLERVDYWSTLPGKTLDERLDGMAFSFFTILDGVVMDPDLPAFDIVSREDGTVINGDCMLHDLWREWRTGRTAREK
jgi:hypothetical protein